MAWSVYNHLPAGWLVLYKLADKRDTDSKIMVKKLRVGSEYPTENREQAI